MTQVQGSSDCGNSPKNRFVQDVAVAIESGKADPDAFSAEVIWERSMADTLSGRPAVLDQIAARPKPSAITVQHAISHGKVGAASGEVTLADGQTQRFSHVFNFTNTKSNCVSVIRSYG